MKSYPNLWPRITSFENLYEAFRRARRAKRSGTDVAAFEFDLGRNLIDLQRELLDGAYRPGPYHNFVVREPTERKISAAPFRDRVVHHALCRVIEPLFDRVFLPHSFANRVGKGTHRALDRCQRLVTQYPYVLKADVSKFFPASTTKFSTRCSRAAFAAGPRGGSFARSSTAAPASSPRNIGWRGSPATRC